MAEASGSFHESSERLSPATLERHRAIVSLMEELEAIDWYDQRIDASADPELVSVLGHNRDEEKEHAVMLLEWLRRRDATWDAQLRRHLFGDGPIAGTAAAGALSEPEGRGASVGIGELRDKEVL